MTLSLIRLLGVVAFLLGVKVAGLVCSAVGDVGAVDVTRGVAAGAVGGGDVSSATSVVVGASGVVGVVTVLNGDVCVSVTDVVVSACAVVVC